MLIIIISVVGSVVALFVLCGAIYMLVVMLRHQSRGKPRAMPTNKDILIHKHIQDLISYQTTYNDPVQMPAVLPSSHDLRLKGTFNVRHNTDVRADGATIEGVNGNNMTSC